MDKAVALAAEVPETLSGERLDKVMSTLWPDYSRAMHQGWIKSGEVCCNNVPVCVPKTKVRVGDCLSVSAMIQAQGDWVAEPVAFDVLFEDADVLVVNKPAGLVVHPGAGNPSKTLLNGILYHHPEAINLPRAGIVHRLDKDTSGVMVVAKTLVAYHALTRAMQAREVKRVYRALVHGEMISGGTVNKPLGRHPKDRLKIAVISDGKHACTHYRVVEKFNGVTDVRVQLETGRTHQIRVHFNYIKFPIVGDKLYGLRHKKKIDASIPRQALHAWQLSFAHPVTKAPCEFLAPLPEDFQQLRACLT